MRQNSPKLLLVDFDKGIAGIEDTVSSGIHGWIRTTTEYAKPGEFREVSRTLAACASGKGIHKHFSESNIPCEGGWNPKGFHGGSTTNCVSVIGLLPMVELIFRVRIWENNIGETVELGGIQYLIRPCQANLMPTRFWERYELPTIRKVRCQKPFGLVEARRCCFAHRNDPKPERVYFAKGTTSIEPPVSAVARIGGSGSDTVVFVDKLGIPIAAYRAAGGWNNHNAKPIPIPNHIDWRRLRSLGRSTRDIIFGVHG